MTYNKKNSHNNEWNGDGKNDSEAHPNGLVHFVIMYKNKWAQSKTYYRKDYTANKFPFPCNDE